MGMIDEIRAQYEKLAAQNKMEAEDMIKARVAKAADQAAKDAVAIKDFKEQVGEYRKTVQTLHMEIDSLRSAVSIFFLFEVLHPIRSIRTVQIMEFENRNQRVDIYDVKGSRFRNFTSRVLISFHRTSKAYIV